MAFLTQKSAFHIITPQPVASLVYPSINERTESTNRVCSRPYLTPMPTRGRAFITFLTVALSWKANMIAANTHTHTCRFNGHIPGIPGKPVLASCSRFSFFICSRPVHPNCIPPCYSQHHSGSAARAKQCSQDCSPGSKAISCPVVTAWAALVTHSTQIQWYKVSVLTFKSRSSATAPTYLSRHIKACGPTTGQAVHQDRLRKTSFSLFCANCLELVAWDNNQRWLTVCL